MEVDFDLSQLGDFRIQKEADAVVADIDRVSDFDRVMDLDADFRRLVDLHVKINVKGDSG